jgi:hypothetical protein
VHIRPSHLTGATNTGKAEIINRSLAARDRRR